MQEQVRERSETDALLARVSVRISPGWQRCSRQSVSTACSRTRWPSARPKSVCVSRLGPTPHVFVGMVFRQVGRLTLVGVAVGLAGAVALGRLAASMLFRVEGIDPLVIFMGVAAVVAVVLVAAMVPVVRASRIDPAAALRAE